MVRTRFSSEATSSAVAAMDPVEEDLGAMLGLTFG
jgi:hypothetical protein